jgi:hypothetical protein
MPRSADPFTPRASAKKPVAYEFVLDELADLPVSTRPMFGSTAVYVDDRIVFILRQKGHGNVDDGVWVVCDRERINEALTLLPTLRKIEVLGGRAGGWRKLAADSPSFEEDVLAACRLVKQGDPRIGKIPDRQLRRKKQASKTNGANELRARASEPRPKRAPSKSKPIGARGAKKKKKTAVKPSPKRGTPRA